MPLRPTASAPPTVPAGGQRHHWPYPASAASSSSTGVPAPQRHRHLVGLDPVDARRRGDAAHARHRPAARAEAGDRHRVRRCRPRRRRPSDPHAHAPSGTCCSVAARRPALGSTLSGLASRWGRTPARSAAWAARSTGREHQRHQVALLQRRCRARRCSTPPAATDDAHDLLAGGVRPAPSCPARACRTPAAGGGCRRRRGTRSSPAGRGARRSRTPARSTSGSSRRGHDGVVQVVVRLDPGDRAERRLAALPQQRPLGLVVGDAHGARRRGRAAIVDDPRDVGVDAVRAARRPRRAGSPRRRPAARRGCTPRRPGGTAGPSSPAPPAPCRRR